MQICESESQHTGTWKGSFEILHTQLLPAHPRMCNLQSWKTVPLSIRTPAPNNKQCPKTRGSWRWLHASPPWARPRTSACSSVKGEGRTVANCVPFCTAAFSRRSVPLKEHPLRGPGKAAWRVGVTSTQPMPILHWHGKHKLSMQPISWYFLTGLQYWGRGPRAAGESALSKIIF